MGAVLHPPLPTVSAEEAPRKIHAAAARREFLRWFAILLVVWLLSGIYEGTHLRRGFVPWDAGAYAESAVRVLHGQLPHRDFIEVYTGGLTYLDAAAMRVFGENLAAERLMLFAFFLSWIPALYCIAAQFCADWLAGAVVLLAVAWSVPNYSEAVPSWYNLFFATFGVAALLAYIKRPSWKWPMLAGMCGGCSFLAKSTGLCYVAGVLLFFAFREQARSEETAASADSADFSQLRPRSPVYTRFLFAAIAIFLMLLIHLISPLIFAAAGEVVLFIVPSAALCTILVANELRSRPSRTSLERFAELLRMCIPFGIGAAVPIIPFVVPYIRAHALAALFHDLFAQASSRISLAHDLPDGIVTIIPTIALAAALVYSARLGKKWRGVLIAGVAGLLLAGLLLAAFHYDGYTALWSAAYWMIPVLVVCGAFLLVRSRGGTSTPGARERVFVLLSVAAVCSLVEFPYSSPIYFCYVAPLAILALAALLKSSARVSRPLLAVLYAAFLIFVFCLVTPGFIYVMGYGYASDVQHSAMHVPGAGGLRVDPQSASVYGQLIPLIRAHAGSNEIYAAPDCPEVYFLSGYRNLTPDIYDFLDPRASDRQTILTIVANPRVHLVVLNDKPPLSAPIPDNLHSEIARLFAQGEMAGHFEVRWRK